VERLSGGLTRAEAERGLTDELAAAKDDEETDPDGLSEADETAIGLD